MRGCERTRSALLFLLLFLAIPAFAVSDIAVYRNWDGVAIPNGGSFAFPTPVAAGVAESRLFRINNTGNTNLNLTNGTAFVTGNCFSQIEYPATPVAPGGATTFRVRFQCSTAGTYSGTVTIRSDDPDENPYIFSLSGTISPPPPPDISVARDWDGVAVPNGGSVPFGNAIPAGTATSLRFRITNDGASSLNLTNATTLVSGTCFSQIETPVTPVAPGGSSYVRVRLQCATAGTYNGTVTISSNDPDENPYRFYVSGTVVPPPPPEISVVRDWDGVAVARESTFTFLNAVPAGQADSYRFRITNSGTGNLDLTNATTLVSGTCFSQIETPVTPVAPGASSYVRVRLQCATPGSYSGTVSISNNDADENPYRFYVAGTVTAPALPEIAVTRAWDGVAIVSGGSFAFPDPVRAGATDSRLFYISNSGNAPLNIANPASLVSGTCFSVVEQPVTPVPAGGRSQFRVRFQCAAPGTFTGTVSIQSNDADENPYTINLSGTAIANGATYVSHVFPTAMNANQFYDVSVTMRNSGTTTWTNAKNYRLGVRPDGAGTQWRFDGRMYLTATESIAPGASKTFTMRLQAPSTAGTYTLQWQMVEELVEWFGPVSPLITVNVGASRNDAAFVSQSVPTTMNAGEKYTVSVTMKNTGGTTWSEATHHRLGNQVAGDPFTHRRLLPTGVTVAPNANYTFSWQVTAPATAGTYTFQWRMVEELVEWFGPFTPATAVTVRVATPPLVSTITPDTIRAGTITNVTITGQRLAGSNVSFGRLQTGAVTPLASVVSIAADGRSMTVRVDASNATIDGFHALVVANSDGKAAAEVRFVPNRPVVDAYTPSQASWGDLYFFSAAGANFSGAQIVPLSSAVHYFALEESDGLVTGILEVDPGAGNIDTQIEIRGTGGTTRVPVQLRDRSAITQKSSLAGRSTVTGSEGVWIQDAVSLLPPTPKSFDWEITCRFRRERTASRSGIFIGLREVGKRFNPQVLQNFARGETRRIQTLVTVFSISVTISVDIFCRINSFGEESIDIYFCIAFSAYVETIGIGGQRIYVEACTGTNEHVSITGSGFWNFQYRWGSDARPTSPCVNAVDRSSDPFSGPRQTDVTMNNCCSEDVKLQLGYKLGEDAEGTRHDLEVPIGTVTPDEEMCPLSLLTITEPPHNPDPPDLADNFSFLAQRAFSQTPQGDRITAKAELQGFGDPNQILWTITPASGTGTIREVVRSDRRGTTVSFIPAPGSHPNWNPGRGDCDTNRPPFGSGKCGRSTPLKYTLKAQLGDTFDESEIVQDEIDIIRQEYRNHDIRVPLRSDFHIPIGTGNFPATAVNRTPYRVIPGDSGSIAQSVNNLFNFLVHDDTLIQRRGTTGLGAREPIVGAGGEIPEVGQVLSTWPCFPNDPTSCDDRREGRFIVAGPNGIAETDPRDDPANYDLRLSSGWRNPERNEAVGGARTSYHQYGNAVDLVPPAVDGYTRAQLWCLLRFAARTGGWEANTEDRPAHSVSCLNPNVNHVHVEPR